MFDAEISSFVSFLKISRIRKHEGKQVHLLLNLYFCIIKFAFWLGHFWWFDWRNYCSVIVIGTEISAIEILNFIHVFDISESSTPNHWMQMLIFTLTFST